MRIHRVNPLFLFTELPSECLAVLDTDNEECEGEEEPSKKWHLSIETGTCEPFMYTGCGGNANKFDTRELCGASCKFPMCFSRQERCSFQYIICGFESHQRHCIVVLEQDT